MKRGKGVVFGLRCDVGECLADCKLAVWTEMGATAAEGDFLDCGATTWAGFALLLVDVDVGQKGALATVKGDVTGFGGSVVIDTFLQDLFNGVVECLYFLRA